jgi:outer membrane protein assembly factor BamB
MNQSEQTLAILFSSLILACAPEGFAQDWPQWRGPNREGRASSFSAPETWPKELARKWKVTVGQGDASPALVGDRLYVFARQGGQEVILCLDTATGKEVWRDGYDALAATGPAGRHPGPRSSPTVAEGKIITYGVRGTLSCLDASTGKVLWRKDDFAGTWPRFFTASSPVITEGLCIAQLGGDEKGGVVAYDLTAGSQKWQWTEDGAAYSSPVAAEVNGIKMVVTLTAKRIVGLGTADGKLLWSAPFAPQGRAYNAATPVVDGSTVIYTGSGRGTKAAKLEKGGDGFSVNELWSNPSAVQFNTPVLKNGLLFGIAQNGDLFCIKAQDGTTAWTVPALAGKSGFGSIADAGPVLVALTPQSDLIVFRPSEKEFEKVTSYKVADSECYAHPVLSKDRIFIKDLDSLTLWTLD